MKQRILLFAMSLALVLLCGGFAWPYDARVKSVVDGDSINVHGPDLQIVHVRLYGIDAPESRQAFGYQAKKRLSKLVSRRTVSVEPLDTDRYGRTVALVRLDDGTLVNEVLVAEGLAWVYEQYCQLELCQRLGRLQAAARQQRLGLWSDRDPERPSDWRKEHKVDEWYMAPVRVVKTLVRGVKAVLHQ